MDLSAHYAVIYHDKFTIYPTEVWAIVRGELDVRNAGVVMGRGRAARAIR